MQTLADRCSVASKKERKQINADLMSLVNRGVVRCIVSLLSREWHEDMISVRMADVMSMVFNKVAQSPAIAKEGGKLTAANWTNACLIGIQVAIELDSKMKGEDNVA